MFIPHNVKVCKTSNFSILNVSNKYVNPECSKLSVLLKELSIIVVLCKNI